jgi:hypothetical protein
MNKDDALDLALEALKHGVTRMNHLGEAKGCMPLHDAITAITAIKQARSASEEPVAYTTGHCIEKAKPGGCQLHNLHCNFPACDRKES